MLVTSFFSWWYGAGWRLHLHLAGHRLNRTSEFFSLFQLVKTLFAPYRQISAGSVKGNLSIQWTAFLDRSLSRIIGSCIRIVLLFIGIIALFLMSLGYLVWLCLWPLLPASPVIVVVFMALKVGV